MDGAGDERSIPRHMNHSSSPARRYYLRCLLLRAAAFTVLVIYALTRPEAFAEDLTRVSPLSPLTLVWLALMVSMVLRLRPSREESLGCQKLYPQRCRPTGKAPAPAEVRQADRGAVKVAAVWLLGNLLVLIAFFRGVLGHRFLVCLAGFYGVCDIICILFFCPFQAWLMHNRCCVTCRIFDWDYLMICTPLVVVPGVMAISACGLALVIFLRWESTYRARREQFFESGNAALRCADCQEHLCRYKRIMAAKLRTNRQ